MTNHKTGTLEEWLAARLELLETEKDLTRRSDELARKRQELPWVRIDKDYSFETDEGKASLADLFRGRSQLLVYHFMFGPDYKAGCPSCSAIADGFNGIEVHLANHDVMLWAVSRAPLAKLQAYKNRMGWTFPWASSVGSDFNADFAASFTEKQQRVQLRARGAVGRCGRGGYHFRSHERNRSGDVHARAAGRERVRARGRRGLSHLFRVFARSGRSLGNVSVARSRAQRTKRDRRLVAPPRRIRSRVPRQRRIERLLRLNGVSD
jgi:predicted dithiol-disulfide oxidoreductase (DUF899 family)